MKLQRLEALDALKGKEGKPPIAASNRKGLYFISEDGNTCLVFCIRCGLANEAIQYEESDNLLTIPGSVKCSYCKIKFTVKNGEAKND